MNRLRVRLWSIVFVGLHVLWWKFSYSIWMIYQHWSKQTFTKWKANKEKLHRKPFRNCIFLLIINNNNCFEFHILEQHHVFKLIFVLSAFGNINCGKHFNIQHHFHFKKLFLYSFQMTNAILSTLSMLLSNSERFPLSFGIHRLKTLGEKIIIVWPAKCLAFELLLFYTSKIKHEKKTMKTSLK